MANWIMILLNMNCISLLKSSNVIIKILIVIFYR